MISNKKYIPLFIKVSSSDRAYKYDPAPWSCCTHNMNHVTLAKTQDQWRFVLCGLTANIYNLIHEPDWLHFAPDHLQHQMKFPMIKKIVLLSLFCHLIIVASLDLTLLPVSVFESIQSVSRSNILTTHPGKIIKIKEKVKK